MKLFEIDIGSVWWFAAEDDFEAMELFREELWSREFSEYEIDSAMDDLTIKELDKYEAEAVDVVDEFGTTLYSLWNLFCSTKYSGFIDTDFSLEESFEEY